MPVLLTDTVGFIQRLPHSLIKAFKSTLEETAHSGLLLHVLDASDCAVDEYYRTTVNVLSEIGAGEIPVITVLNKFDMLESHDIDQPENIFSRFPDSVAVSAKTGFGLDILKNKIVNKINGS
jgi:GTP-binding protein HflX